MNFSWIEEEERLTNLNENSKRENISTIEFVSMYINQQNEIETIERETMDISSEETEDENKRIPIAQLIEWRDQRMKYTPKTKYSLKDILLFHVPIEAENIPEIKAETKSFLTIYSDLEDIPLPPAIFIFHSLTTLFFCFHETEIHNPIQRMIPKNHKKTVKITIPTTIPTTKKIRITRKSIP